MTIINKKLLSSAAIGVTLFLSGCGSESNTANPTDPVQAPSVNTAPAVTKKTAADLPHYLNRDVQDEVFYFVLPDRFHNGDTENDNGSKTIKLSQGGFNKSHAAAYHGGDIRGLEQKLPYLKDMGITAIWLTPILRNQAVQGDISGYHGYWVLDFTEIDPHLGTNADLKSFIDASHEQNIKVYFDIITNHTADVIKYAECHGEDGAGWSEGGELCPYKTLAQQANGDTYTTVLPKGSEGVKTPVWLNETQYYHNQGDSTFEGENSIYGDFFGLDDINTDDPRVVAGMIDIFKNIIDEFKPDGFRIDTVKHVNIEFWQSFAPALHVHALAQGLPEFFMFGEVYDGNSDVLSKFTTTGKMQSVLDFGFQGAVKDVLVDNQGTDKLAQLFANDHKYNDEDSNANQLLNFVGNHDMGRFAWMLRNSEQQFSESEITQRFTLAHAMMYFLRGIPVVYYGDEQGFVGDGGNHDSRQDMMPSHVASFNDDVLVGSQQSTADDNFDQSNILYKAFSDFASIYLTYPELRHGEQDVIFSSAQPGIFAVTRTLSTGEQVLVAFNTDMKAHQQQLNLAIAKTDELYASQSSSLVNQAGSVLLKLAPLSVAIYQIN
ncbi:alpha-amylase family glycosyl hydrolase [Thalassotalea atypica]|uniref:alpha-amylase family glycosyl hydrolase n=1 Tax=Thalassotalea atypica TaxID=2054316 RepID=UPI002572DFA7|nr:alpha-amylase family glycosyl hydrolase [Thalassotalea atypica]